MASGRRRARERRGQLREVSTPCEASAATGAGQRRRARLGTTGASRSPLPSRVHGAGDGGSSGGGCWIGDGIGSGGIGGDGLIKRGIGGGGTSTSGSTPQLDAGGGRPGTQGGKPGIFIPGSERGGWRVEVTSGENKTEEHTVYKGRKALKPIPEIFIDADHMLSSSEMVPCPNGSVRASSLCG